MGAIAGPDIPVGKYNEIITQVNRKFQLFLQYPVGFVQGISR